MPPSIKNPSEKLLLQVLTGVVSVLGTLLLGLITMVWNSIDDRLANIEGAFVSQEKSIVRVEMAHDHLQQQVQRHEFLLTQQP
jgi:hypothetical protein